MTRVAYTLEHPETGTELTQEIVDFPEYEDDLVLGEPIFQPAHPTYRVHKEAEPIVWPKNGNGRWHHRG